VLHQAALGSVPRSMEDPLATHESNVTGFLNMLIAARDAGVKRFVYAGSSAVYGDHPRLLKVESELGRPLSPYAATKAVNELYAEVFARCYDVESIALRYFNVFGPRQDPKSPYSAVIPLFITAMLSGESPTVYGDGRQSRDFTYVGNVVHANLLAMDAPNVAGHVFNAANGRSTTLVSLIEQLNQRLGTKIKPNFAPSRVGDVRESLADISRARALLGYEPQVDFETGLGLSIDYYRSVIGK
jgi:nucleoside-diphosphate-sugar epimerase